jgi:hypothetical protein
MRIADCGIPIADCARSSNLQSEIRNPQSEGPEAHQDEFSTFNREVVGSTPTRPTKGFAIADFERYELDLNRKLAIGNRK